MRKERDIFSGLGQELDPSQSPSDKNTSRDKESTIEIELLDENCKEMNIHEENDKETINEEAVAKKNLIEESIAKNPRDECIKKSIDGINIILLKGDLKTIASKRKYKNKFNQIHLSQHAAHNLGESHLRDLVNDDIGDQLRDDISGIVTVETGKFIFPLQKKEHAKLSAKIIGMGKENGFVPSSRNENSGDFVNEMDDLSVIGFKTC